MHLAVFGGAFDPIHLGHCGVIDHLLASESFDRVCLVPTGVPVFHKEFLFSPKERLHMLELLYKNHPRVNILDYELNKAFLSYMKETLDHVQQKFYQASLTLVIGYDQFLNFHRWRQYQDIFNHCRLMVIPRQGLDFNDSLKTIPKGLQPFEKNIEFLYLLPADVSSSQIRTLLDEDASIEFLVPDKILSLIKRYEVI